MKVAMLSGWHVHAKGYGRQLQEQPGVTIAAVWDDDVQRGTEWAKELNAPFYADLDEVLAKTDIDSVCVNVSTDKHCEVMVKAANAKKHIFTEKVMAMTVAECQEIAAAVRKAGTKFCISFPHRAMPHNLFAKQIVDEGLLGDITVMRVRNAHDGAAGDWLPIHFYDLKTCGGGAMMDLGAHVMYLSRWIMGKPVRMTSIFNARTDKAKQHDIEDNAISMIEFENKGIAIAETSFVSASSPYMLELYGTEGSLLIGGPNTTVQLNSKKLNANAPVNGWVSPARLPKALPHPIEMFVKGVDEGADIPFDLEAGIQLTELMAAAYKSHKEDKIVDM